jgi:ribosomal-protein-alanine N-acetyltransferase
VSPDFLIETERLTMRRITPHDADLMLAVWNDPAFVRYVGDRGIRTIEQAAKAIEEGAMRLFSEHGFGPYRMALKTDDTAVGICGIFAREGMDEPDLGFSVLPEFCKRGFAYESAVAVIRHARVDLKLPRLTAIVSPENAASVGLIEKLGLQFERMIRLPGENSDISLYAVSFGNQVG